MTANRIRPLLLRLLALSILFVLFSPLYMYFSHDVGPLITEYPHRTIQKDDFPTYTIRKGKPEDWANLKSISHFAKWAIVLSEDWGFYEHQGFDVEQMKVALNEMMKEQRFRGASTITQQMVKNVFLSQDRSLWRKIHELILAQKVERVLSKSKILEVYLNCIEYGPGIYGIKNASRHYFKKNPSSLDPKESAFLAMLLPSPKRYYISFKKKKLTSFARQRVNAILTKMRMAKIITPEQFLTYKSARLAWEKD